MEKRKNKDIEPGNHSAKRSRYSCADDTAQEYTAGKIERILMKNFMCHDALEVLFNKNVNFIVGQNGSGKSAILTALTLGLGARANITSRAATVKEFVKNGKKSASIEITLVNKGPRAFKPDIYGESITVVRNIGAINGYKLKSSTGEVITTKRAELDNLINTMNIQINNPISILNQDVSRTFLVASKSKEKYELFMRATRLDICGKNYKEARTSSQEAARKLENANEVLNKTKEEVSEIKKKLRKIEGLDVSKQEVKHLDMELQWARVLSEESKLQKYKENLNKCNDAVQKLADKMTSMGSRSTEIDEKIKTLQTKIQEIEQEFVTQSSNYDTVREKYISTKESYFTKTKEWRTVQNKIARLEDDINFIKKEIERRECGVVEQNKREEKKKRLADLQQNLDEVEAMLRTKQTDKMHLESNDARRKQEINKIQIERDNNTIRMRKLKQDLSNLEQQVGNALNVFGSNIPRVHKCIEEEYRKGHFKRKPIGPIGAYIKMKDPAWAPAVESYLGASFFNTFLVDNGNDAKTLSKIMKEIFIKERSPQFIVSKFRNEVYDTSRQAAYSPHYSNMLQAMEITYPEVTNCLIDQFEVERILLIPTTNECCEIMSEEKNVPRNCRKAITLKCDTFFPYPNYRSYSGKCVQRARYLQASRTEAIKQLKEELATVAHESRTLQERYQTICEEAQKMQAELKNVNAKLLKLESTQKQLRTSIYELTDMINIEIQKNEAAAVNSFHNELAELEKKLQQDKIEEKRLSKESTQLKNDLEDLEKEMKNQRDIRTGINIKITPLKDEISRLNGEKESLKHKDQQINSQLDATKSAANRAAIEYAQQKKRTEEVTSNATKYCPRIETNRSESEIKELQASLKRKINDAEQIFGTKKDLAKRLKEKTVQLSDVIDFAAAVEEYNKMHLERLIRRKELYEEMKSMVVEKVQNSFSDVLALRNYSGEIHVDHVHMMLDLKINSQNRKDATSDGKSLSGGERSYSMVAFILALWECTEMPFYFLDEFDVFMDKVNRRMIMDILLDHAKSHPQSQFTFLTPLDTSNVKRKDFISIHQLTPPERD